MRLLRWLRGDKVDDLGSVNVASVRRAAIRAEMEEHPAERGEVVGRKERNRLLARASYWRAKWGDRESGG